MCESVGGELAERARAVVAHFKLCQILCIIFCIFSASPFFFLLCSRGISARTTN